MLNEKGTVVLGYGPQTIDWLAKVSKLCGKNSVMCPDTARMAGANLAGGTPEALAELRKKLEAGALQDARSLSAGLTDNQVKWLATGNRGLSSETLFSLTTGVDCKSRDYHSYPRDPSDLARCRKLIDQCPELLEHLHKVKAAGAEWSAFVDHWDQLCATMDTETPEWRDGKGEATKTYNLMKELIEAAQAGA